MNAKEELSEIVSKSGSEIKCADITYEFGYDEEHKKTFRLNAGHSEEGLNEFLTWVDFEYDNDYGGQELFGTVWLKDGTWLERGEYDGSEWWEHKKLPEIPSYLV